jgi:hypothetical protein
MTTAVSTITIQTPKPPTVKVPPLIRVKSSSVAEMGFGEGALFVRFAAGSLYRYPSVSAEDYAELGRAPSIGRALAALQAQHKGVLVPEVDGA